MSPRRHPRIYTPAQRIEIVEAGTLHGRPAQDVCRTYQVPQSTYYRWRAQWRAGGRKALGGYTDG